MALTALMFVILIISFALMFGLVEFSENVIAAPESVPADGSSAASASDAETAM